MLTPSAVSSLVYKYQLMFVFVTHVESGGVSQVDCRHVHKTETLPTSAVVECRCQSLARIRGIHATFNDFK